MPLVKPFALDQWVAEYRVRQPKCNSFIHDSCISPLSLDDLRNLGTDTSITPQDESLPLSYGTIRGSSRLRSLIAATFTSSPVTAEDVLVTSGAISANFLILDTLCGPQDHVICSHPTYGQLCELPRRAGAEVSLWRQKEERNWQLDIDELKAMIKHNTKMIVLNNPCNPTGAVIPRGILEGVVAIAAKHDILVFSDEVFRPLFHDQQTPVPPSLLELDYPKSIVTGSMSKAYALPGIRLGWIAVHPSLRSTTLQNLVEARDYTTISVSQLDDQVASFALQPSIRARILERSAEIAKRNIAVLESWAAKHLDHVRLVTPKGAGTGVLTILGKDGRPVDDVKFCAALAEEEGVLAPPALHCFGDEASTGLKGGLRVGIVMKEGMLEAGLAGVENLMKKWGLA